MKMKKKFSPETPFCDHERPVWLRSGRERPSDACVTALLGDMCSGRPPSAPEARRLGRRPALERMHFKRLRESLEPCAKVRMPARGSQTRD